MPNTTFRLLLLLTILTTLACGELRVQSPPTMTGEEVPTSATPGKADNVATSTENAQAAAESDTRAEEAALEALFNYYEVDYLAGLPKGEAQRESLCARGFQDRLSRWYCGEDKPTPTSLDDLLVATELKELGAVTPESFAVTGHSSSLVGRRTSSINPRVVYFSDPMSVLRDDYITMGYVRGDFLVEVAAFDGENQQLNFYLVKADKACEPHCTHADRFAPTAEINWESVSIYPTEDLENTVADCLTCHKVQGPDLSDEEGIFGDRERNDEEQKQGDGTRRILRMQELRFPWTHWFATDTGSNVLLDQFRLAHSEMERYGTIPTSEMDESAPASLERFIIATGFEDQPNAYNGMEINADQPLMEERSPVWEELYANALQGEAISPPHFGINPYDDDKIRDKVTAYKAVVERGESPELMPDMNDIFRDDLMDELGFEAGEGLDAKGIVQHRCGFCHSGTNPDLSRDNFNVADFPNNLSDTMKRKVVDRINLGKSSPLRMPPTIFTDLAPEQIDAVEAALQ